MRLREFWQRAGALPRGVMTYRYLPDQGLRELVALDVRSPLTTAWSAVFAASLEDGDGDEDRVPAWMAPAAMIVLGFKPASARLTFTVEAPSSDLFRSRRLEPVPEFIQTCTVGVPYLPASLMGSSLFQQLVIEMPADPAKPSDPAKAESAVSPILNPSGLRTDEVCTEEASHGGKVDTCRMRSDCASGDPLGSVGAVLF